MNIEGEWTMGSARLLRDLSKAVKSCEEKGADLSIDNKGEPDLLITDMKTGWTARVKGTVLRKADHRQRIRHKRPPKVVEALLLEVFDYSMRNDSVEDRQEFWAGLREWLSQAKVGEVWEKWTRKHDQRIKAIESMLDEHLNQTMTDCTGQTFIKAEVVSQEQRALLADPSGLFDEIEGWGEPEITQEVEMEEHEYEPDETIE